MSIYRCKCVVVGGGAVGKTSIMNALLGFPVPFSEKYEMTRGVTIFSKIISLLDTSVTMEIYFYDFSGQSIYHDLVRKLWANNVTLVVGVFDITREESYLKLQNILTDFIRQIKKGDKITGIVLGNKNDLSEQRVVSSEDAQKWSKKQGMGYFDVSAKNNISIEEAFYYLAKNWLEKRKLI